MEKRNEADSPRATRKCLKCEHGRLYRSWIDDQEHCGNLKCVDARPARRGGRWRGTAIYRPGDKVIYNGVEQTITRGTMPKVRADRL